jgi:hypothetical protein
MLARGPTRAETDDRGEYRMISIAAGDYLLQAETRPTPTAAQDKYPRLSYYPGVIDAVGATPIRVSGPTEMTVGDLKLPDVPAFTVSGKVINSVPGGRLLPNGQRTRTVASFFIGPRDTTGPDDVILVPNRSYTGNNVLETTPFELPGFVAGSYYIYPIIDGDAANFLTHRTPVDVTDKNVDGLVITISSAPDMKGKVVVEGDASSIRWEGLRVNLRWKESVPSLVGIRAVAQTVDPSTREFTLKALPEARFLPLLTGLPPDAYISDLRQGVRDASVDGINPSGRDIEDPIEIVVNTRGGTIQGTVQDSAQQPVRAAGVVLVPDGVRRGNSLLYKRVSADSAGHFTMRGVAPGAYKLFAWKTLPEGSGEESAEFIAPFEARGVAVNVQTAAPVNIHVRLIEP